MKHLGLFRDNSDETLKSVFECDNGIIEITFITNKQKNRNMDVFCIPTHHYCNLGCKMCHLTAEKTKQPMRKIFNIDLSQALERTIKIIDDAGFYMGHTKCLLSFMGVGEPLLNIDLMKKMSVSKSLSKLYSRTGIAFATMMPSNDFISLQKWCIEERTPFKIHFSMHTPFDSQRKELLPCTKISNEAALSMLADYRLAITEKMKYELLFFHSDSDPTEIHYTLINGVNDSPSHLLKLIELEKIYKIPIKFIKLSPVGNYKNIEDYKQDAWVNTIKEEVPGLKVKVYDPPGKQIGSSCGEFTKHYYLSNLETEEDKKEFEEWHKKHFICKD